MAGALLAQTTQFVGLDTLGFGRSADVLVMLVLGGAGRLYGAIVGTAVFMIAQDYLSGIDPVYWQFWLGLGLVALVSSRAAASSAPSERAAPPSRRADDARSCRTEGLTRRFGALEAVSDVSLALPRGARHALIGPNGAGKTTLINLLTGALAPSAGEVWLGEERITGLAPHARVKRGLARTFQINTLFPGSRCSSR